MKLPERTRRQTKVYELEETSNYELLLVKHNKPAKKAKKSFKVDGKAVVMKKKPVTKKKAAKKTSASKVEVPVPALSRAESKKCDQLARTGSVTHKWQYVGDSGKWQDYDKNASDLVEMAYSSWQMNPEIDVRAVSSGDWAYQVDFNLNTQTNVRHHAHKVRKIQRVPRM